MRKEQIPSGCKIMMELWDETIVDISATCVQLGPVCLQMLGIHALSGCDSVSRPFSKGKISTFDILQAGHFSGLSDWVM